VKSFNPSDPTVPPKRIGSIGIHAWAVVQPSPKTGTTTVTMHMALVSLSPAVADRIVAFHMKADCIRDPLTPGPDCGSRSVPVTYASLADLGTVYDFPAYTFNTPASASYRIVLTQAITTNRDFFEADVWGDSLPEPRTPRIRCDVIVGVEGCEYPQGPATIVYDHTELPYITANIVAAQAAAQATGKDISVLHRTAIKADADAHRRAVCGPFKRSVPPPAGMAQPSCDEYPFAASMEGGAGAVAAWVPLPEQNSQGGRMTQFYIRARVAHGDAYHVATQ
jgi:hypothetical protein